MLVLVQPVVRLTILGLFTLGFLSTREADRADGALNDLTDKRPAAFVVAPPAPTASDVASEESRSEDLGDAQAGSPEPVVEGETLYRVCRVTAYCDRGKTASGVRSGVGQCAAPGYIPLGSTVYVPALERTFVVTDRTHKRFRKSTVDIFIPSKHQCRQFGREFLECEFTIGSRQVRTQNLARFRR